MDFFQLTEIKVFGLSRVCSDDSVENDFIDKRQGGGFRVLKHGSIPSVRRRHISAGSYKHIS